MPPYKLSANAGSMAYKNSADYALTSQIPLSVSQLENDVNYLTEH